MKTEEAHVANATDQQVADALAKAAKSGQPLEAALEELRTGSNGRFQQYAQMFDAAAIAGDSATQAMVQDAERAYFDVASNPADEGFRQQLLMAVANIRARAEKEQAAQAPAGNEAPSVLNPNREVQGTGQYTEDASKGRTQGSYLAV